MRRRYPIVNNFFNPFVNFQMTNTNKLVMSKKYYLPRTDSGKLLWLQNFALKFNVYVLDQTNAEKDLVAFSNDWFTYAMTLNETSSTFSQNVTQWKNLLRGGPADQVMGPVPVFTAPAAPGVANPGPDIFGQITKVVNRLKNHANYTLAIGEDLGIEGDASDIDTSTWKPLILAKQEVNKVVVGWSKSDADGIDIYADYGNGQFVFVATDTKPNYDDMHPLPAAGQTAIWKYKAVYKLNDTQVGQYSDVVSVTVVGNV